MPCNCCCCLLAGQVSCRICVMFTLVTRRFSLLICSTKKSAINIVDRFLLKTSSEHLRLMPANIQTRTELPTLLGSRPRKIPLSARPQSRYLTLILPSAPTVTACTNAVRTMCIYARLISAAVQLTATPVSSECHQTLK